MIQPRRPQPGAGPLLNTAMTHLNRLLNAFRPSQPDDLDADVFYPGEPDDTAPEFVSITGLLSVAAPEERAVVLALHRRLTQEPQVQAGSQPSGVLAKRMQAIRAAQSGGPAMGLTLNDLTHSFVFGETGTGMTSHRVNTLGQNDNHDPADDA